MRQIQLAIAILAFAAFIAALFLVGTLAGDALWRAGMAALLFDVVIMKLWPTASGKAKATSEP